MPATTGTDIDEAVRLLSDNELVAIPTETVYGLAANALSPKAVVKIFEAKKRPFFDPLIVHIGNAKQLHELAQNVPEEALQLAKHFWPGPLTLILPRKEHIPDIVTSGNTTVGVRMPNHKLTLELLRRLPFPLAAPSANPFGYVSPTEPGHVAAQLGNAISYILDGGPCEVGVESTIVGFEEGKPVIYRLGGIAVEEIEKIVGKVELQVNQSSNPAAPGQLKSHYAPGVPVFIGDIDQLIKEHSGKKAGVISFTKKYDNPAIEKHWVLSASRNLNKAARRLFKALRETDEANIDIVLAEKFPEEGLGRAINDRLKRAAAK